MVRRRARKPWATRILAAMAIGCLITPAGIVPAQAATVTIVSNYATSAGVFDPAKYLNANEGGYLTHKSLNWLPEAYGHFADAGMQFVTITHLLNENFYNVVSGTAPDFHYDFKKLDRVVLPLVKAGITPVMGLAFTPQVLGGADRAQGYSNAIPNDNALWGSIVQHLVEHYRDLGHTGWYWEVWNEPSLGGFWAGTQSQYNAMYRATADGVKAADPTAQIGGAATHTPHEQFMNSFVDYLGANPTVPLDFLSVHEYNGPFDLSTVRTALSRNGRAGTPMFITEWNSTPNMTNGPGAWTDTNATAGYAARMFSRALAQPDLAKIFFFSPKEGFAPSMLFDGDLGMVTVDNHRKAVYNTFKLFSTLPRTLFATSATGPGTGTGQVGAIAAKDPASGKTVIIAWNDQTSGTDISLSLNSLPYAGSNVKATRYLIDATHANYYSDFAAGIRGWDVGPTESLDSVESPIVAGSSTFSRSVAMGPNSVTAYVLEPTSQAVTDVPQAGPTAIPPGTRNLAFGRPVIANSSLDAFTWSKAMLVDGLTHTFSVADRQPDPVTGQRFETSGYSSQGHADPAADEWVGVDLGSPTDLGRAVLWPRDDKDCEGYGFPVDFTVETANAPGGPWTEQTRVTGSAVPNPAHGQSFKLSGQYRYVRVHATKLRLGCPGAADKLNYLQLAEMQVYSTANIAAGAAVRPSSTIEGWGWEARYATDGVETASGSAHGWSSQWGRTDNHNEWLDVDFGTSRSVSRVDLYPRDDSPNAGRGFPTAFTIQVATNAECSAWTTVLSRAGYPNPGSFRQTFGFAARDTRCVRVLATGLDRDPDSGLYLFQLSEVRVYH